MFWKHLFPSEKLLEKIQFRMAVKVGVAASLGLFLGIGFSQAFNRPDSLVSGLWTVITAIVVVQAYLGGTYQAAWVRFLGTFVGTFIGCLCTVFLGSNAISLGFSVFGTVIMCTLLGLTDSLRIASITVAVLNVLWGMRPEISPWIFGIFRFLDSCIGILVAVIVAHTMWPTQATRKIRLNLVSVLENLKILYGQSVCFDEISKKRLRQDMRRKRESVDLLRQTRAHLGESKIELRTKTLVEDWVFLIDRLEEMYEIILSLSDVPKQELFSVFDDEILTSLKEFIKKMMHAFDDITFSLKERKIVKSDTDILYALEEVNEELERFRREKIAKRVRIANIEAFFVFTYRLKELAEELVKIDERVQNIYS